MSYKLRSNKVRVRDPKAVREILNTYLTERFEVKLRRKSKQWSLVLEGQDDDLNSWGGPGAIHQDQWPSELDAADVDRYAWLQLISDKGDEGFHALLRELAPHLEGPLLILEVSHVPTQAEARAWSVTSEGNQVHILEDALWPPD